MPGVGWWLSDVGRKRPHNEDACLWDAPLGLGVVADGMGGHAAGEVASRLCVEHIREVVSDDVPLLEALRDGEPDAAERVQGLVEKAIQTACREIYDLARSDATKRGMGTTCVAIVVGGSRAVIGHVGDSRVYLWRQGRVHQLTTDHTLVEEHVKRGIMTRADAETSNIRNVITRAVGVQPSIEVDTLVVELVPGDLFLLSSDGLHGYLRPEELPDLLAQRPRARLVHELIDVANSRGGKDNITALLVSPEEDEQSASVPPRPGPHDIDVESKAEILRRIPLFQYMTYKELLSILAGGRGRVYAPGDCIVSEGSDGDEMFVVFRGTVDVSKEGTLLTSLGAGGHFGEMGLVENAPRSATVVARESTNVLCLGREPLLKLMRKDSHLAVKLLWSFVQVLSERLRSTTQALSHLQGELNRARGEPFADLLASAQPRHAAPFGPTDS